MKFFFEFFVFIVLAISLACSGLTPTPSPTATPQPTATLSPTETPKPISIVISAPSGLAPRWMILGQPFYDIEILGETWNYADDRWGETYACIDYIREKEPYVFFEQCFAFVQPDLTFESQRDAFLAEEYEILTPTTTFGAVGEISLLAKRLIDNSEEFVKFFEIIGVGDYLLLVEMNLVTDETSALQEIYENNAAETINYVLQSGLEKSKSIPRPAATPLSPIQEEYYNGFAAKLITESEASELYFATWIGEVEGSIDGTWEALGDHVATNRKQVCRIFEDRTNADVRWVSFRNCVFAAKDFPFEDIPDYYKQPGDVSLTSSHEYTNDFLLYAYNDGRTYFDAYILVGDFIYYVTIASRTLAGEKPEDIFNQTIDDFLYNVLIVNLNN